MPRTIGGMQLTEEDIREFQVIWRKEFKEEISFERARREASLVLELYSILLEPADEEPLVHGKTPTV